MGDEMHVTRRHSICCSCSFRFGLDVATLWFFFWNDRRAHLSWKFAFPLFTVCVAFRFQNNNKLLSRGKKGKGRFIWALPVAPCCRFFLNAAIRVRSPSRAWRDDVNVSFVGVFVVQPFSLSYSGCHGASSFVIFSLFLVFTFFFLSTNCVELNYWEQPDRIRFLSAIVFFPRCFYYGAHCALLQHCAIPESSWRYPRQQQQQQQTLRT